MTEKCDVCKKDVDENCLAEDGKKYCCEHCKKFHEDPEQPDEKPNVCEFC